MEELEIIAEFSKCGYSKYYGDGTFTRSSLKYIIATISNFENDIKIYSFKDQFENEFYMWSNIYNKILRGLNWNDLEDVINFGVINFYINEDKFLIPKVESIEDIYTYEDENSFTRPIINGTDSRIDLGDKRFIVSDAGILFSVHEKLEHKLIDSYKVLPVEIKIIKEKTKIGTLSDSFEITVCHLIPIESTF
jgi:hypothetical protein